MTDEERQVGDILASRNETTAVRTFGSVLSEALSRGHGQHLYTVSRIQSLHPRQRPVGHSENCFETRTCFCNRRIDLHLPRTACATRRRGGCSLGRGSKRHEKGPGQAQIGPVNGRSTNRERFVPRTRKGDYSGSACLRISAVLPNAAVSKNNTAAEWWRGSDGGEGRLIWR